MPANGGVLRGHGLERAAAEIAGEDDVHDVLGDMAPRGGNRVHDRHRSLERQLVVDADLLGELSMQGAGEALDRVDAATREQPVLAVALLVAAEQDAPVPAPDR